MLDSKVKAGMRLMARGLSSELLVGLVWLVGSLSVIFWLADEGFRPICLVWLLGVLGRCFWFGWF